MDPNVTLKQLREHITQWSEGTFFDAESALEHADQIIELTVALDNWLSQGRFLPDAWEYDRHVQDTQAMNRIVEAMSGQEWSADTLDFIADVVRASGRTIEDSEETSK